MGRSGTHQAKSGPPSGATGRGAAPVPSAPDGPSVRPDGRIAELEAKLAVAVQALQSQRSTYDEDSASFEKALSRLAQSERALSQTKARLVDADTRARDEHARAEALSAELAALRASAAAEIGLARESTSAAEAREQQALAAARAARFEQAANGAELEELQTKLSDLQTQHAELAMHHGELTAERALIDVELSEALAHSQRLKRELEESQHELAAAAERNAMLTHERTRLLGLLASLDVLAREITHLTEQAATVRAHLPKVEAWLGRDVEAEHVRATVRPEGMPAPAPPASRAEDAPEILVDGVKLES
jgi:chromosome segregation ATPase